MTDREKSLDTFMHIDKHIAFNEECGIVVDTDFAKAVEYVVKVLFSMETVQRWIPVAERLPEESGQYIVCCDDSWCSYGEGIWYRSGVIVCAEADVGINGGICWEWSEGSSTYDLEGVVTHWMPLPEPPKEEVE